MKAESDTAALIRMRGKAWSGVKSSARVHTTGGFGTEGVVEGLKGIPDRWFLPFAMKGIANAATRYV